MITALICFGLLIFILNYNETDEYLNLIHSSIYNTMIWIRKNITLTFVSILFTNISCPLGYASCTNNPILLIDFVLNKQEYNDCNKSNIPHTRYRPKLYTHIQGDWYLYNESAEIYLNVTKSTTFKLHRLYYSDLNIVSDRKKYLVLMNSISTCNQGRSDLEFRIKGLHDLYYSNPGKFHDFQCNLNLQNKSHTNITYSTFNEYSFLIKITITI